MVCEVRLVGGRGAGHYGHTKVPEESGGSSCMKPTCNPGFRGIEVLGVAEGQGITVRQKLLKNPGAASA
jgi:hypothetical protein